MKLDLDGKHALITGGSKGIGQAVAADLLAEGASVTLVARDLELLKKTQATLSSDAPGRVQIVAADLASDAGRSALVNEVGTPDILVNNAGAIRAGALQDMDIGDIRNDWNLKVFGYIHLCQLIYPQMVERGSGTILNIIGMAGRVNRPAYISGSAANAALIAFTQALGADAQTHGLRVLGLNPSLTLTGRMTQFLERQAEAELGDATRWEEMIKPDRFPYGRPAHPEEVAALAVMMLSPRIPYLNGTVVDIDGGGQWTGS